MDGRGPPVANGFRRVAWGRHPHFRPPSAAPAALRILLLSEGTSVGCPRETSRGSVTEAAREAADFGELTQQKLSISRVLARFSASIHGT